MRLTTIKTKMKGTEQRAVNWLKLTEQTFDFACYAHKAFLFGDAQTKRKILSTIVGLNCTMKDHILNVQAVEWLVPIKEQYPVLEAKIKAFEPEKYGTDAWDEKAFAAFSPEVRAFVDAIGASIQQHGGYIFVADLALRAGALV